MKNILTFLVLLYFFNRTIYCITVWTIILYLADKIFDIRLVIIGILASVLVYLVEDVILDRLLKNPDVIKYLDEHKRNNDDS